jgi:hypothetical protein
LPDGSEGRRGSDALQVDRRPRTLSLHVRPERAGRIETATVSLAQERLRELLGSAELPRWLLAPSVEGARFPLHAQPLVPRLARLLDDIMAVDPRRPSRALWYEAKALEFVALVTELFEAQTQARRRLPGDEVERLEGHARAPGVTVPARPQRRRKLPGAQHAKRSPAHDVEHDR